MQTYRENPEGEENQRATKQHEREMFALKMQAQVESELLHKLTLIRNGTWLPIEGEPEIISMEGVE